MDRSTEQTEFARPGTTVTATGMKIARLLVGKPPQTVSDLIHELGVTRTAVTEQLNELIAAGFVQRTTERLQGRGRPHYLFKATDAALTLLFASNQRLVVPAIWQAVEEAGGEDLVEEVLRRVSHVLAEHYKPRVTGGTPEERLRQMCSILDDEGSLIELEEADDGQFSVVKRSCPFISMFEPGRAVCTIDQDMMSEVVGAPVRRTSCRHDGAPCCRFELVSIDET